MTGVPLRSVAAAAVPRGRPHEAHPGNSPIGGWIRFRGRRKEWNDGVAVDEM